MEAKKKAPHLLAIIVFFAILFMPTTVYADPVEDYEEKTVTTYVYDKKHTTKTTLVFRKDLPSIPYIDVAEYLNLIYKATFTEKKVKNGVYTVSAKNASMKVDTNKDTIYIESYNELINQELDQGEGMNTDVFQVKSAGYVDGKKAITLDMTKYKIDLLEINGKLYFPLPTIRDMFAVTYNLAQYIDGKLYYVHTSEILAGQTYYSSASLYEKTTREASEAEFSYNELCFLFDHFYGAPSGAYLSAKIEKLGLDKALDVTDDTKKAKQYLKSTSMTEYAVGLFYLGLPLADGGHTIPFLEAVIAMEKYPDSKLVKSLTEIMNDITNPDAVIIRLAIQNLQASAQLKVLVRQEKTKAIAGYKVVKTWKADGAALYTKGDTAIFAFDDFEIPIMKEFKWSVDYAAKNGFKNFIVDLSTNGGGLTAVGFYMLTIMTNTKKNSNTFKTMDKMVTSGEMTYAIYEFDLNMDGKIDDKDKKVGYDLNFAFLTTSLSFSSGNLIPVIAKDYGIALLGEKSGGGGCIMSPNVTADEYTMGVSGVSKFETKSGVDVDLGAAVDYDLVRENSKTGLKDYGDLYNMDLVSQYIHEFYKDYSSEWINGTWYNKNGKPEAGRVGFWKHNKKGYWFEDLSGWYAKNQWQKIDGKWYYFDKEGYMESNAYRNGYYLTKSGAWDGKKAAAGWKQNQKGWWYALSGTTCLKKCWKKINGSWYYFKSSGYAAKNEYISGWWIGSNNAWTYKYKAKWTRKQSGWFFGDTSGWVAKKASYSIDEKKYSFDANGLCLNP